MKRGFSGSSNLQTDQRNEESEKQLSYNDIQPGKPVIIYDYTVVLLRRQGCRTATDTAEAGERAGSLTRAVTGWPPSDQAGVQEGEREHR